MKKAGIINLTAKELEELIRHKISSNYIYNLSYIEEHDICKFNIIIQMYVEDIDEIVNLTVAFSYKPGAKVLKLITLF